MDFILSGMGRALELLLAGEPEIFGVAWLSLRVSLSATVLAALAALPLGLAVGLGRFPGRQAVVLIFNTLLALPTVVVGLLVYGLLSRQGPLGDWRLLYTPGAMTMAQAILAFPLLTALTIAAARGLDARVGPTARTLGASPWQAALTVIGESRLALAAALAAGFGRVLTEVGAAIMVGGNIRGYTRTLTTAIVLETSKGDFAQAMALGLILLAAALGVNILAHRLQAGAA